jgi:hypothetical protein
MKQPSIEQKYLALATLLPVLADFMEDLKDSNVFRQRVKQRANHLIDEIRECDAKFYQRNKFPNLDDSQYKEKIIQMADQQLKYGMSFRSWISREFPERQKDVSL